MKHFNDKNNYYLCVLKVKKYTNLYWLFGIIENMCIVGTSNKRRGSKGNLVQQKVSS